MQTHFRFLSVNPADVGAREFSGIAATSGLKDDGVDLVMSGGDVTRLARAPLLFNHNPDCVLGRILNTNKSDKALSFKAVFASVGVSRESDEKCALLKDGILNSISLSFEIDKYEPIKLDDPRRQGYRATKWRALEISLVAVPLDVAAMVTARSQRIRGESQDVDDLEDRKRQIEVLSRVWGPPPSADYTRRLQEVEVLGLVHSPSDHDEEYHRRLAEVRRLERNSR